ncbi:hypothetical protein ACN27F_32580 [Solwaraspora sp. WMMB335]|uniref:hypothetical protein n=1 Tax=Solwaraspora sp. WMMB335 TaxID=3404118 RepID=UPI003B942F47
MVNAHGSAPAAGGDTDGRDGLAQSLAIAADDRLTAADLLVCDLPDGVVIAACWSGRLTVTTAVEPLGLLAAALQRAQLEYLTIRPDAPPRIWAGLAIVGDGFTTAPR